MRAKRILVSLLLACLLASLAACGGGTKDGGDGKGLSATVYVPSYSDCKLPLVAVSAGCAGGGSFYLAGQIEGEGNGTAEMYSGSGEQVVSFTISGLQPALFRVDGDGGETEELTGYVPFALPEGRQGQVSLEALAAGGSGTLWLLERIALYQEDGGGITAASGEQQVWRHLDSSGAELGWVDVAELSQKLGVDGFDSLSADTADRLYALSGNTVYVLDSAGELIFSLSGESLSGQLIPLADGVGIAAFDKQGTKVLRLIDSEAQNWGGEYPLPADFGSACPGGGEDLFYCDGGISLYRFRRDGEGGEKLLDWSAASVDQSKRIVYQALPDGRLSVLLRKGDSLSWPQAYELALLTPTDASQVPEKTVLRLATLELDYRLQARVADFNKHSAEYRIEIVDYGAFNASDGDTAGLTKLNAEIVAGNIPDILDTRDLPVRRYAAKGLLEDLWPYIENDPELGREGVMEHVLQAAEIDGKLCQVFGNFTIRTAVGATEIVGDRMTWTLEELRQVLASMPEGCKIFGQYETKETMLDAVLSQELGRYVDWSAGTCGFDAPSFLSLLEFCGGFSDSAGQGEEYHESDAISQGRQMLMTAQLRDFTSIQSYKAIFGGDVSFVGYPTAEGCGSAFVPGAGLALSSACEDQEAAWSFIRSVLLPEESNENIVFSTDGFPTNKAAFQDLAEKSMKAEYQLDEDGELELDGGGDPIQLPKAAWADDNVVTMIYATTQAEYDQIMALYEAVDAVEERDEDLLRIVRENAAAYFGGGITAPEAAQAIQSRVKLYINEQK